MGLMDKIEKELKYIDDIATLGIKECIKNKNGGSFAIIKMIQEMCRDGYKGFSLQLSKDILNF